MQSGCDEYMPNLIKQQNSNLGNDYQFLLCTGNKKFFFNNNYQFGQGLKKLDTFTTSAVNDLEI